MLNKFLAHCFVICVGVALSLLVMINGWGLQPKSWFWILGVGFVGQVIVVVFALAIADKESK